MVTPITTLNGYQAHTGNTAIYPGQGSVEGLNYSVMGMIGEAGEVANRFKKVLRDDNITFTNYYTSLSQSAVDDLVSEVGDTLWYCMRILEELGVSAQECANRNIEKLQDRAMRAKIAGAGNNR